MSETIDLDEVEEAFHKMERARCCAPWSCSAELPVHPRCWREYVDALGAERASPAWAVAHVQDLLSAASPAPVFADVVRCRAGSAAGPALARRTAGPRAGR